MRVKLALGCNVGWVLEGRAYVLIDAWQSTRRSQTRMWPKMAVYRRNRFVHPKPSSRRPGRTTHSSSRPDNPITRTLRTRLDRIPLILTQQRSKLREQMARIPLKRITKATLGPILLQQTRERLQAPSAFNQRRHIDLASEKIAHVAFVIVQRGDEEEVHEGRAVAAVVEDCFRDFLPGLQGFYESAHAGVGGLGTLQEAAVAAYDIFAAVLGGVVEF